MVDRSREYGLKELLDTICSSIEEDKKGRWNKEKDTQYVVDNAFPNALRSALQRMPVNSTYVVKGQSGNSGNWNKIASIAIMDQDICANESGKATMKAGVYPVFLFSEFGERVYLSLAQSTTGMNPESIKPSAEVIRSKLDVGSFRTDTESIDLGKDNRFYAAASIAFKEYVRDNIPSDDVLFEDLKEIVGLYSQYKEKCWTEKRDGQLYNPGISEDLWLELLSDDDVTGPLTLDSLYKMLDLGGSVTCKELSLRYGNEINYYNRGLSSFGKRVWSKTGCIAPTPESDYWNLPFTGKYAESDRDGVFAWTLRPELKNALERKRKGAFSTYTREDFDNEVFIEKKKVSKLIDILSDKKCIILQGPPGVGKTFVASRLAALFAGSRDSDCIETIQFHQSYGYEEFIYGLRPTENGGFSFEPGVFFSFCTKAENDSEKEYFFIIDEINRANISRVFGETMMLVENSHRSEKVKLMYNGTLFSIPSNIYIIGTMNTADRSIAIMDYALRRRFAFIDLEPNIAEIRTRGYPHTKLLDVVEELNLVIENDPSLGKGFRIGHSYFTGNAKADSVVENELIPLISEYWYDDEDSLRKWSEELRKSIKTE